MPEMEPHETFDGMPATFEVGDYIPAFESRSRKFHLFDSSLFDNITGEARERAMERPQFLHSCIMIGKVLAVMDPEDRMAVRNSAGFETPVNYMDDKYCQAKNLQSDVSPSHSFRILPPGLNILMELSNKYGVSIEEAFERTIRIGTELSSTLREEGNWTPIYRKGKRNPVRARFFSTQTEKKRE